MAVDLSQAKCEERFVTEGLGGDEIGGADRKRRDQWEGKIGAQDEVASGGGEGASHEVSRFQVNATQYEARAPKSDLGFVGISKFRNL